MSDPAISPLAPERFPSLPPVAGVSLASYAAGLRYEGRADLMLALVAEGSTVAGVLTKSLCPSAPVDWCRKLLGTGGGRAIVVNSGNANAFTGAAGETAAAMTAEVIAAELGLDPQEIYLASTGVIGETLPSEALAQALPILAEGLVPSNPENWLAAAEAIRTTDTYPKGSGRSITLVREADDADGAVSCEVVGIAKGSGMIAPHMATMLSFVFTDAPLSAAAAQSILAKAVDGSFNSITVDSDTSTSDTVLLFATGVAGGPAIEGPQDARYGQVLEAVSAVTLDLAHQIVRDGEGATKFVTVEVQGADSGVAAKIVARSIADSPLVKTAVAAADANWGRIVMAVGKAGQRADRDRLAIWIGDEQVAAAGVALPGYDESRASAHMAGSEVLLRVDLGVGSSQATIWTCDLTHQYIDINAGYRS